MPTERRRPRRACADRAADARARRRVRRRASSDITALSFCCSLRHRPSSVIVRESTLATPSERRAASELALSRCRASLLLHLSPWRLTNNAGSRAVSRQGPTIHVFDIVAGIGRRSAVLRRRGLGLAEATVAFGPRLDGQLRLPRRLLDLASPILPPSDVPMRRHAHGANRPDRQSSALAAFLAAFLFGPRLRAPWGLVLHETGQWQALS